MGSDRNHTDSQLQKNFPICFSIKIFKYIQFDVVDW